MYNKEALRKELEDAMRFDNENYAVTGQEWLDIKEGYITTRLAALDDDRELTKMCMAASEKSLAKDWVDDGQEGKGLDGAALIATERQRQKEVEGWTSEHDNTHIHGELAKAAACYAVEHTDSEVVEHGENAWPWDDKWWKPSDPIKNLVKAGALIAAEIDRIKSINHV